jgi:ABC-type branched-subunit amino acid transport system ATPase component
MPLLETRKLKAFYGDFQALYGIDTTLEKGETIAIIGANGAGKSTFLRAIAGLIHGPPIASCSMARRSVHALRPTSSSAALRSCRRGGGCFLRLAWKRIS